MDDSIRLSVRTENNAPSQETTFGFDADKYMAHLDVLDISEERKAELIHIVWDIMRMWVEMELPAESCGQILNCLLDPEAPDAARVDLRHQE